MTRSVSLAAILLLALGALSGCSSPTEAADAGPGDGGRVDGGGQDGGPIDSGPDTGHDGGRDAGAVDAGHDASADVGPDAWVLIPCSSAQPCDVGLYCVTPDGACDGDGYCEVTPREQTCPGFEPVCGCNGFSYENRCIAERNGIAIDHTGLCDGDAPCATDADCATGFCEKPDGVCGEGMGVCVRRPIGVFCAMFCAPQCGCDGVTYLNSCFRVRAGTTPTGEHVCAGGVPPCAISGACCTGNLDCQVGQQCVPDTNDGTTAVCEPIFGPPACWTDADCNAGMTCQGLSVCPCGMTCPAPDAPGTCG